MKLLRPAQPLALIQTLPQRLEDFAALGLDATEYDYTVFQITSEISRQVFPMTLDLDNPAFRAGLERLRRLAVANDAARAKGGLLSGVKRAGYAAAAAATFAHLFLLPVRPNTLPDNIRMAPAW